MKLCSSNPVTNALQIAILLALLDLASSLNARNYQEYKEHKNQKRQVDRGRARSYTTSLRRDWDFADVLQYFRNERLVILQIRCFFDDGPCDLVGKWAKGLAPLLNYVTLDEFTRRLGENNANHAGQPEHKQPRHYRVVPGFFGICEMCTRTQQGWFDLWLSYLHEKFPDLLRSAMIRFLLSIGIDVPEDEVKYMYNVFRRRRYGSFAIRALDLP